MKSIDELRGFLSKSSSVVSPDEVYEYVDAIERELEEGYVALPKYADGKPIRIGDVVTEHEDGYTFTVDGFKIWGDEWWVFQDRGIQASARKCHHKPPTVEDVLREFAKDILDLLDGDDFFLDDTDELCKKYAKRMRLKEGE